MLYNCIIVAYPMILISLEDEAMTYTVHKVEMWSGEIDDRVGGLVAKLEPLASAGADLEIVIARRQPHLPGKGIVFLGPLKGAKVLAAAQAAGIAKTSDLAALRVEGPNKPGEGFRLANRLKEAGINLRGFSATVLGKKFTASLGFDSSADADKAASVLQTVPTKRK